jgi:prepilin peptidase CpaA
LQNLLFHNAFLDAPVFAIALLIGLLIAAALYDIKTFTIPHIFTYLTIGLFVLAAILAGLSPTEWGLHFFSGILGFLVAFGLFVIGMMGGGDVKLFGALALWVKPIGLLPLVFWVTIMGMVISLTVLAIKIIHIRAKNNPPLPFKELLKSAMKTRIPYGPAIAVGTTVYLLLAS